jgi:hypothetical protein
MKNIEIPRQAEKTKAYLFFEKLPAILSWSLLATPIVLSQISARATIFFILAYILLWFIRMVGLNVRVLQGWRTMQIHKKLPWHKLLEDLENRHVSIRKPKWHRENIERLDRYPVPYKPSEIIHAVMIASYNESINTIEPTVQAVIDSNFDARKVILVMAYEGRDGAQSEKAVQAIVKKHGKKFLHAIAVKHPLTPGEVRGKGGNITFAAKELQKYLKKQKIDPGKVVVTTLDSDNRPHPNYLPALTYTYSLCPEPKFISFQPIPMFTNNIWDAPAPMRVIATGNSFWMIIQSLRPHILRNFSAHAQSMRAIIDTDFWSVRTIVEDGHQFWRTYFRYDGKHEVYPIFVPIYQDAVLADGYRRTLKAQFIQLRRWAWGASDIAYVITKGFLTKNKISLWDKTAKTFRLIEGHISWATAPPILLFSAFIPVLFNPDDIAANQLPNVASTIQRVAMIGLAITLFLSFKALPPKPLRYKRHRTIFMVLQWAILPITTLGYSATSALYSQTRLALGKYLDKFDVTEKHTKK